MIQALFIDNFLALAELLLIRNLSFLFVTFSFNQHSCIIVLMNKLVKQAFTLIELLVVIAIIGILSGLIVVSMGGMTTKASIAKAQVFSNSLRNSLMLNLVSEWKLDGDGTDFWGDNDGTITGPASSSDCVFGTCYAFDGTNDYINIPDAENLNLSGSLTIEVWIKLASITQTNQSIIAKNASSSSGYWLYYNSSLGGTSKFNFYGVNNSAAYSLSSPELNKWTHIVVIRDGTNIIYYINGVFDVKNTVGGSVNSVSSNPLRMGSRSDGVSFPFNGSIDNVRIYNTILSASQIEEQYYAGLNSLLLNGGIKKEEYLSRINSITLK